MSTAPNTLNFLDDLRQRNLLNQCTHEQELAAHLASADVRAGGRRAYAGFDPTADSLTIGNLVGIIALRRWQQAGHTPIVIMGGGTGLIGDPSGKSSERQLRTRDQVAANVQSQRRIFERLLDFSPGLANRAHIVNNLDWLGQISYLDALRDIGKHFSVNMMIQKDSVKDRLHNRDQGISYTEFSYMILQAYDFAHLYEQMGVTVQMGGSDQFGNIVVGIDLIRKGRLAVDGHSSAQPDRAFGLTWPLVTKSDGTKFGKTESGAIWLTANRAGEEAENRTSPYQFYQFWLNAADADVVRFLKTFSVLPIEEIHDLERQHLADPGKRVAHTALAQHMTALLHGPEELAKVEQATKALFSKGGNDDAPFVLPDNLLTSAPASSHELASLQGDGVSLVDVLAQTTLVKSKTEARTQLAQNAISVNGRAAAADARLTTASLLPGNLIALRRGKKTWHITRWA